MSAEQYLQKILNTALEKSGYSWHTKALIEPPREAIHGDLATNIALVLAKEIGIPSHNLASQLAAIIKEKNDPNIASISVAGPGFINITFSKTFWQKIILDVEKQGDNYGSNMIGHNQKVHIEYVSANPTGPLHIGHGRGAAIGDSLARILRYSGYSVTTEYYINDAGRQMHLLGLSIWLRVQELSGINVLWPEEYYKGQYIIDIAKDFIHQKPQISSLTEEEGIYLCYTFGMNIILHNIKKDLELFRVEHQVWYSEQTLMENNSVEKTFTELKNKNLIFEQNGALWFKSTQFGDDKDRVLRKSDDSLTYFASDIAYHHEKYTRGFDIIIDVLGADHHGYFPRIRAAIEAFNHKKESFKVVFIQLVKLLENGIQIAMSTRTGQFETLHDLINDVGVDAARFIFLSRKSDSQLDFDLELVKQRTMDNPVYYVQYAYARVCSIIKKAKELNYTLPNNTQAYQIQSLDLPEELRLLRLIDRFKRVICDATQHLAPHYISHYLKEISCEVHSYYANHPILQTNDTTLITARLILLRTIQYVIKNALELLGISAPESM